ncbi:TetR/AcrR family transcriptional regulator C-terminal domain-containing protein [Klugiella xanthotipulae]|uniref:TetR family transcriptional regulator n=1 Tax=Klugiella xanthotipulae TaxID=244735 RepID=A0A543I4W2_9MICO|nr:TetR/AcrR family transcriptional regulator C-terminal domain-containing protein [Klugiella xanthotipulae]TQM65607.1 TetR family transcriptional regulator [Klugiella xanthotipulae]
MRNSAEDVVKTAIGILDEYGLPDLSMRRLATALGVQPSALYWHFESKQALLAAMATEIVARGHRRPLGGDAAWDVATLAAANELRDSLLAYRDGAELVATAYAFGLGGHEARERLAAAIAGGGFDPVFSVAAAAAILHFVFGYVSSEQQHMQASSLGAAGLAAASPGSFDIGLSLIVDGIRQRRPATVRRAAVR